ncbi:MBL fold metallo-hydrolase [Polycladospora coralii]|uniref:MBL fold metallo-hydrolase n=1 Tax=Polycladospora coralii TaxID=2771432 RepID=UPI001CD0AF5D|nr:MBL fold metallo-hydrolase [Polycladospora coralii]
MKALLTFTLGCFFIVMFALFFMRSYEVFGGKAPKNKIEEYQTFAYFKEGRFQNAIPTTMDNDFSSTVSMIRDFFKNDPNRQPTKPLPVKKIDFSGIKENQPTQITWLGHSAVLLQIDGKAILFDPMLGESPSPFSSIGSKRFQKELPFQIEDLPPIDAVFISHDHYDHLDHGTIKKLKAKVNQFFVPLGIENHLVRWGVDPAKIQAMTWWDETEYADLTIAFTPARHFSGRSLMDRNATLWGSWVLIGKEQRVYFSGDSGYGPHFKEIGKKYGPFDFTMMESGQYDDRWAAIHMKPEESIQAHLDVKGKAMMPIHWGAFTLAFHDWTDPVERELKLAEQREVTLALPQVGEKMMIKDGRYPSEPWWRAFSSN